MRPAHATVLAVLAFAACEGSRSPSAAPARAPAAGAVGLALAVWERGAEALPAPPPSPLGGSIEVYPRPAPTAPFCEFDEHVRCFLADPEVADAVQWTCTPSGGELEPWIERGLDADDPHVRLRALVALMRVRAPRSVERQWRALQQLGRGPHAAEFAPVAARLCVAFAPDALDELLALPVPNDLYSCSHELQWGIRAAGVTGYRGALDRLAEIAGSPNIDTSLAAERSLADFAGPDADAALARCVEAWHYASGAAAHALLRRDPERLRAILLAMDPQSDARRKGLLLARLDDRRAVPILCRELPNTAIVDGEMFEAIIRLAGPEHLLAVLALPERVRPEQRDRAVECAAVVRARLGR